MPINPRASSAPLENSWRQPDISSVNALQLLQPYSSNSPAVIFRWTSTKRKCSPDPEAEPNEPGGLHPELPQGLSEEDLRSLYDEVMNSKANKKRADIIKRSSSPSEVIEESPKAKDLLSPAVSTASKPSQLLKSHFMLILLTIFKTLSRPLSMPISPKSVRNN